MEIERLTTVYCAICLVTRRVDDRIKDPTCPACGALLQGVVKEEKDTSKRQLEQNPGSWIHR